MEELELQKHIEDIVSMHHIGEAARSQRPYLLMQAANLAIGSSVTDIADMKLQQTQDYLAILSGSRDALLEQDLQKELAWLFG